MLFDMTVYNKSLAASKSNDTFNTYNNTTQQDRFNNSLFRFTTNNQSNTFGNNNGGIKVVDTSDCSNPKLAQEFNKKFKGVLAGKGAAIVEAAKTNGIDPKLLGAIVANESGWGTSSASNNKNNVSGTMDSRGIKNFDSIEDCLNYTAKNLKNNYINQGLTTISSIGSKYCPVGAANDPAGINSGWVPTVTSIYNQFKNDIA